MATQAELIEELMRLDDQYEGIAGHNAFLYLTDATENHVPAYHFMEGYVVHSAADAVRHMRTLMHDLTTKLSGSE